MAAPDRRSIWDGVRNYQARNLLRDQVALGDGVLFYHSSTRPPHVAGIAKVCRAAFPDPTAFDPQAEHFDPKSIPHNPRWFAVEVEAVCALPRILPIAELRTRPLLFDMPLLQKGQRLSIQPLSELHWLEILGLAGLPENLLDTPPS
ncbi:MAG: EVE domain-containing protein [Myxococcota bacterium]|nr:EVE domain-containing protein [Myxococcota bacterium]